MKNWQFLFILFFFSGICWGSESSCKLDKYFVKTEAYKTIAFNNKRIELELDSNKLSLLPDLFVSVGQNINNENSFKKPEDSSVSIGVSQSIYEGNRYGKKVALLDIDKNINNLKLEQERIQYIIRLFSAAINYQTSQQQKSLYLMQLERQLQDLKRFEYFYTTGEVAKIELEVAKIRVDEIKERIKKTNNELKEVAEDIYLKYEVPEDDIKHITYNNVLNCKTKSINNIRAKQKSISLNRLYASNALDNTLFFPSVNMSISLTPPKEGTLRTFSTEKSDFSASLNVSVPISNFFLYNNQKSLFSVALDSLKMEITKGDREFHQKRSAITRNSRMLRESIQFSKSSLALKQREVNYLLSRLRDGKETVMTYFDKLDEYNQEEIDLIRKEREFELDKVYLYFLD
ncbi:TolC family protein [Cronobacter sakazakii]|nr:TolC family protein [Cronobacter sakazakii]